ncbi:2OG-Fe(II) oxygenase [Mycobacterium sp. MUNTM1]
MAVCFLWHFPASHLGLPLAITLLCEVRTFLEPPCGGPRPPGQLVRDDPRYYLRHSGASNDCSRGSIVDLMDRWQTRVDSGDWDAIAAAVGEYGGALLPRLITPGEAARLRRLCADDGLFRSTIDMAPKRYGAGQYRYFHAPYPEPIEELKQALYPRLLPIARDWWGKLRRDAPWPDRLDDWLAACHAAGQSRSTALMLKYGAGDWNALHRDLYGDLVFPLQVVINLSNPGSDYTGGEFLLVEQRLRAQSRGMATQLPQGHGYVFTTRERPVPSARGWAAAPVRHGVSVVRSGERYAMGLIFHDAA